MLSRRSGLDRPCYVCVVPPCAKQKGGHATKKYRASKSHDVIFVDGAQDVLAAEKELRFYVGIDTWAGHSVPGVNNFQLPSWWIGGLGGCGFPFALKNQGVKSKQSKPPIEGPQTTNYLLLV